MLRSHRPSAVVLLAALLWSGVAFAAETAEGPMYGLAECIGIALEGSPSLAISRENEHIAGQGVTQAWGAFLPSASISKSWNKSERTDFDVAQTTYQQVQLQTTTPGLFIPYSIPTGTAGVMDQKTSSTYSDYGASMNWNLFDGFAKFGGLKSARKSRDSATADRAYTRQLVIQNVTVAYLKLVRDERLLEVAQESQDLAERELERSETYHRIGSAAKSDVLQAKVRVEQTKLDVIRARNTVEQSFAELAHAMNRPLAQRFQVDRTLMDRDMDVAPLGTLFDEALANREDLRSRELQVEAREGDVTSAGGNLWPSLDLFARYSKYENESPFRFGAQKSDNLSYGYQVSWNVFDRLQSWTGRSQAKARQRIAEYNLDQARLDVQLEVRQLYNAQVESRERVSLAQETIVNAEEELRLAQERFRVGAGTMLDRITAQVNLATARADEVSALADYVAASLQLDRAVGRSLDALLER
ncbi:MAG TPA: TolC family protein [Candidatus Krumholzibacteria bacterium]|mgnify:CR=1 FL=1|nr:TolC family protein [Candidatus Krumholzibacteria bacterium]HRX50324.1 TolC family protein [Candidatus Krumholzibacteria bacterium]